MTDRELPISDERLKELSAGLSDEAREVLDRLVANQELDPELRHPPEEFVEDLQALPENDREQLSVIFEELQKGYDRRIKQNEAELEILKRGQRMVDRAKELDPSLVGDCTLRGAATVLKAHGEPLLVSEKEMNVEMEFPPGPEDMDWISIPVSEIDTDENGIPTRKAAPHGFGIRDQEGGILKLYPRQAEAMRAISGKYSYREFVEENLDEIPKMKQEYLAEFEGLPERSEAAQQAAEELARQMVNKTLRDAYLNTLAEMVRQYPRDPQGIIDHSKGRHTKAARRYESWRDEQEKAAVEAAVKEVAEGMIEKGIFEKFVGEDGVEYIRPGPNFEEYRKQREAEQQA